LDGLQPKILVVPPESTERDRRDYRTILERRYSGMLAGEPRSHFLGGGMDLTFKEDGCEAAEAYKRLLDPNTCRKNKLWRDAYHQIGFIASHMGLPDSVREEIARAYANLRKSGRTQRIELEKTLGLLTYLACRIQRFPRSFGDVQKAFRELYGVELRREDVTGDLVSAFNYGRIRFGVFKQHGRTYLCTWQRINGKQMGHRSLGRL